MANEIDDFLNELRNLKQTKKTITNSRDVWAAIGQQDWSSAGFDNEEEAKQWIEENPYSNL